MGDLIISSLIRVFWGFLIALALAFPLGIIMGRIGAAEALGRPIVEMFRPIPPLAWVPIFLLVFGSFWGPAGIVFLGAFFPILLNVMFGVKSVDPMLIDAARTLGAKRSHVFTKVIVPSSIPYLMTGVTVGLGVAWMCIVAAEITPLKGGVGLGYYILYSAQNLTYDLTYATMIVIGILSMLTTGVAALVERRVSKWMGLK
jgi:NitT/TauT family transport system permease protein